MDESIEKSGSLFYGLNSPTLKVASLNLVSRTKKSASRQGCGLFDMIGGKQTCGLQVRSTFNPPEAVRRAAPSQVASLNLVSRTTSSQAMYRLRRHFYALHPNVVVRSRRCDSFQNCNHHVGLQFCCLGCGLFDMIGGKQTCGLQVRSTFNPPEAVRRAAPSQVASSNLVWRSPPPPMGRRDVTFFTDLLSLTGRAAIDITWPTSQLTSEPAEDFGAAPAADGPEAGSRPGSAL